MGWTKRHLHIDLSHAWNQTKDASQQCILAETLWPLKNKPAGTVVSAESLSHGTDPHKRVEKREATNAGGCAGGGNLDTGSLSVRFRCICILLWGVSLRSRRWHHILGRQGTPCGQSSIPMCHVTSGRRHSLNRWQLYVWLSSRQV